jgi:hypothetical protein
MADGKAKLMEQLIESRVKERIARAVEEAIKQGKLDLEAVPDRRIPLMATAPRISR